MTSGRTPATSPAISLRSILIILPSMSRSRKWLISFKFPHKNCARNTLRHLPRPCHPIICSMTLPATFGEGYKSASFSIRSSLQPPVKIYPTDPSGTASMLTRGSPLDVDVKTLPTCYKRTLFKARTYGRQ